MKDTLYLTGLYYLEIQETLLQNMNLVLAECVLHDFSNLDDYQFVECKQQSKYF